MLKMARAREGKNRWHRGVARAPPGSRRGTRPGGAGSSDGKHAVVDCPGCYAKRPRANVAIRKGEPAANGMLDSDQYLTAYAEMLRQQLSSRREIAKAHALKE